MMEIKENVKKIQTGVSAIYLFGSMSYSIMVTVLPLYMNSLQYSSVQIGFIIGAASFVSIFFTTIWGIIDDKLRKTSFLLLIILIMLAISSLALGVANIFIAFLLIRIMYEIFSSGYFPLLDKTTLQVELFFHVPFPIMRVFGSIGYAIVLFPVILLIDTFNNYQIAFVFMIAFFLLSAFFTTFLKPVDRAIQANVVHERSSIFAGLKQLLMNKPYIIIAIVYMLILGAMDVAGSFQGIHLTNTLDAPKIAISLTVFISAGVSEVPMMYAATKIHRKFGWYTCITIAISVFLVRLGLEAVVSTWQLFVAVKMLHGITIALLLSPVLMLVKKHVPQALFSTAITLLAASKALMVTILSITVGYFNDLTQSTYTMYSIFFIVTTIGLLLFIYYRKKYQNNTKEISI